jgi:hypothetical protein
MTEASVSSSPRTPWVLGAVILLSPVLFLATCHYIENPTSRYPTYQAAREAGALEEGRWIPPFLPQSSRNIVETHNIDTNSLKISFDYSPGDLGNVGMECRPLDAASDQTQRFECLNWGLPIEVHLERSGKGLVVSRR